MFEHVCAVGHRIIPLLALNITVILDGGWTDPAMNSKICMS